MAIPKKLLDKIKKEMVKNSPEMKGVEPIVETKEISIPQRATKKLGIFEKLEPKSVHTFTFKKTRIAEDGAKVPIIYRITTDGEGNVIKKTGLK